MRLQDWLEYIENLEKTQVDKPTSGEQVQEKEAKVQTTVPVVETAVPKTQVTPVQSVHAPAAAQPAKPSVQTTPQKAETARITRPETQVVRPTAQATPTGSVTTAPPEAQVPAQQSPAEKGTRTRPSSDDLTLRIPEIEDYLPFLRSDEPEIAVSSSVQVKVEEEPAVEKPADTQQTAQQALKPSSPEPAAVPKLSAPPVPKPAPRSPEPEQIAPRPASPAQQDKPAASAEIPTVGDARWDRLPRHLRTLATMGPEEIAQRSYKRGFRETRNDLLERLLDPPLTLEDAARILNVCPTTVRRYTNKGVLPHFRTVGNQRRFRLSDIIAFMEASGPRSGNEIQPDQSAAVAGE